MHQDASRVLVQLESFTGELYAVVRQAKIHTSNIYQNVFLFFCPLLVTWLQEN